MSIYLKVTNRCDIRCPHCFISDYTGDMSLKVVDAVGKRYRERVIFHGGEPTLVGDEYLREAINILGKRDYAMQSNLMKVGDWLAPLLKEYFNGEVGTSFDVGRIKFLNLWLKNISFLSSAGINVVVVVTVTSDIINDIARYIRMFEDAGAIGFYLQFVTPVKTPAMDMREYLDVFKKLSAHRLNRTVRNLQNSIGCAHQGINGGNCAKNGVRTIDTDGTVYVCPDFAGQKIFPLGNIRDKGFDDSVSNKNNRIFYEREKVLSLKCSDKCWNVCRGGCVSFTYFNQLNCLTDKDPYCNAYKEILNYVCV